jgi:hypothetical protein
MVTGNKLKFLECVLDILKNEKKLDIVFIKIGQQWGKEESEEFLLNQKKVIYQTCLSDCHILQLLHSWILGEILHFWRGITLTLEQSKQLSEIY